MTLPPAAPTAPVRKPRNVLGIIAFWLVVLAFVTPLLGVVFGIAVHIFNGSSEFSDPGWAIVPMLFYGALAFIPAGIPAVLGLVLGVASLFVKNKGRVFGIIAIVLAFGPVIASLIALAIAAQGSGPTGVPL